MSRHATSQIDRQLRAIPASENINSLWLFHHCGSHDWQNILGSRTVTVHRCCNRKHRKSVPPLLYDGFNNLHGKHGNISNLLAFHWSYNTADGCSKSDGNHCLRSVVQLYSPHAIRQPHFPLHRFLWVTVLRPGTHHVHVHHDHQSLVGQAARSDDGSCRSDN